MLAASTDISEGSKARDHEANALAEGFGSIGRRLEAIADSLESQYRILRDIFEAVNPDESMDWYDPYINDNGYS